jgi:hypothetical protein
MSFWFRHVSLRLSCTFCRPQDSTSKRNVTPSHDHLASRNVFEVDSPVCPLLREKDQILLSRFNWRKRMTADYARRPITEHWRFRQCHAGCFCIFTCLVMFFLSTHLTMRRLEWTVAVQAERDGLSVPDLNSRLLCSDTRFFTELLFSRLY